MSVAGAPQVNKFELGLFVNVIFTAHRRSLGQGNIFRSVCFSFHGGSASRGGPVSGGSAYRGSAHRASVYNGGLHYGVCPQGRSAYRESAYRGVCLQGSAHGEPAHGGSACRRVCIGGVRQTLPRIRKVGGMHPTEMLTCFLLIFCIIFHLLWK